MDEHEVTRNGLQREWYERWRSLKWLGIATKNLLVYLAAAGVSIRVLIDCVQWLFNPPPK